MAIIARWAPIVTRLDLPGDAPNGQCRYPEAAVNGVLVASIYAPNGNPQPGPKFDYKLALLKRLTAHAAELSATGAPVVLAGDYNVVPTDLDIYPTKSWDRDALLQPERCVLGLSLAGVDRRHSRAPSQRTDVHVLGLHVEALGTRRRSASRQHSAEFRFDRAPARRRRQSSDARIEGASDQCARVGETSGCAKSPRGAPLRQASGQTTIAAATALPKTERSTHRTGDGMGTEKPCSQNWSARAFGSPAAGD